MIADDTIAPLQKADLALEQAKKLINEVINVSIHRHLDSTLPEIVSVVPVNEITTSPVAGTTLTGTTLTVTFSDPSETVGTSRYGFWLGTERDTDDIYNNSVSEGEVYTDTPFTITGLPTDSQTIHITVIKSDVDFADYPSERTHSVWTAVNQTIGGGAAGNYRCGTATARSTLTQTGPLVYSGATSALLIEDMDFNTTITDSTPQLLLYNCTGGVTVRNCYFNGNPITMNNWGAFAIHVSGCTDVVIDGIEATNFNYGVRADNCEGIQVRNSTIGDCDKSEIMFNNCRDSGASIQTLIERNYTFKSRGRPRSGDSLSFYKCKGSAARPFINRLNMLESYGEGYYLMGRNGGGCMAGDGFDVSTGNPQEYLEIRDNAIIAMGHYAVTIAGGRNNVLDGNWFWSKDPFPTTSPPLGDSTAEREFYYGSGIGLVAYAQKPKDGQVNSDVSGNEVTNNKGYAIGVTDSGVVQERSFWIQSGHGTVSSGNDFGPDSTTEAAVIQKGIDNVCQNLVNFV